MKHTRAEILREYGPFPHVESVHGVSFDGQRVWFASGDSLNALDPDSGEIVNALEVTADAGTAFDGTHLFQIAEAVIRKIDPRTGEVLGTIPAPGNGGDSGLAWAERLSARLERRRVTSAVSSGPGSRRLEQRCGTDKVGPPCRHR